MAEAPIEVTELSARYRAKGADTWALRDVSLAVPAGSILGVMGESGSGKTTLARILAGVLRRKGPSGFDIELAGGGAHVRGHSLAALGRKERAKLGLEIAFLEQDASARLDARLAVEQAIAAPLFERDKKFPVAIAEQRVDAVADAVGLPSEALDRTVAQLSDGDRQRVAIARALVLGPSILIADEPTAGIDQSVRDTVLAVIGRLREDPGFAALLVTHDLGVLRTLDADAAVLHHGTVVARGPIDSVFTEPAHPYVARLARALGLG